jgi:membrane protease YdiL (CAAX protease family)
MFYENIRLTTTLSGKFKNLLFAFSMNLIWVTMTVLFLHKVGIDMLQIKESLQSTVFGLQLEKDGSIEFYGIFFLACIFAPLWEEAVFRYFPIRWAFSMGNMLTPMIVMSSMIFGIMHGSILNILFQGVGGLIISWVYLKNGSYWWSVLSHSLWNIMIIFAIPLLA